MQENPPKWDEANPARSFERLARYTHARAKRILRTNKHHDEMFFFVSSKGEVTLLRWSDLGLGHDRNIQETVLRDHIRTNDAYGVIHAVESWVRVATGGHTDWQLNSGEMRISQLRPADRGEVLTVDAQSRDGSAHSWSDEILRNEATGS